MKKLFVLSLMLSLGAVPAAFGRGGGMGGGMGSHMGGLSHMGGMGHMGGVGAMGGMGSLQQPVTGGAFGTSPAAPGTNAAGTALSSSDHGGSAMKGPELGTGDAAIDREDAKVDKIVGSICRGC
jgi:hypothetical protein